MDINKYIHILCSFQICNNLLIRQMRIYKKRDFTDSKMHLRKAYGFKNC